jgi:hypothetical protein
MTTVEVIREGGLITAMAEMRDWLDAQKIAPDLFQHAIAEDLITFYVTFKSANEATAFAVAFDGRIVAGRSQVAA